MTQRIARLHASGGPLSLITMIAARFFTAAAPAGAAS